MMARTINQSMINNSTNSLSPGSLQSALSESVNVQQLHSIFKVFFLSAGHRTNRMSLLQAIFWIFEFINFVYKVIPCTHIRHIFLVFNFYVSSKVINDWRSTRTLNISCVFLLLWRFLLLMIVTPAHSGRCALIFVGSFFFFGIQFRCYPNGKMKNNGWIINATRTNTNYVLKRYTRNHVFESRIKQ